MTVESRNTVGRFAVNLTSTILTSFVNIAMLIWVNHYLLHRISPEEYSLIPIVNSLVVFAELFRNILAGGITRFMVEAEARDDQTELARIVSSMTVLLVPSAFLLAALGALGLWHIDTLIEVATPFRDDARLMLGLMTAYLALEIAAAPFSNGLVVHMRFVTFNLITLGALLIRVALIFLLLFMVSAKAVWVILALVLANAFGLAVRVFFTLRILPGARFRAGLVSGQTLRTLISFSGWTAVQSLGTIVQRAAPALILNRMADAVAVTAFHIGSLPDTQIRKLVAMAATTAQPSLTSLHATGQSETLQSLYYRGGRYHLWAALFLTPPLIVFATPLVILYAGAAYADTATVLVALLIVYPLGWGSAMFYQIAYAIGQIRDFNLRNLVLILSSLGLLWLFTVPLEMGAIGAAYGFAIAFAVVHVLVIWPGGLKLIQGRWREFFMRTMIPGTLPFAASLACCALYQSIAPIHGWGGFILGSLFSFAAYLLALLGFSMDETDRKLVEKLAVRLRLHRRLT
ncbi:lipopolysaccharide biosynthesis protein [Vannielia sp. SX4]|uniref:lipopolysaccharide biosynthesis protein n=1 Tax=Vannielia sp. SX4 TaxID=3463852 RepID=UPI00405800B1